MAARLANGGTASRYVLCLGRSFLAKVSLEVCHQAIELLSGRGLTDDRLLRNCSAVLQITAQDHSFQSFPPLVAERS